MLWEWKGKDKFGEVRSYQTQGPDISAASMLVYLRGAFRNLEIAEEPTPAAGFKPATGIIERHAFNFGIIDAVERELGIIKPDAITTRKIVRERFFKDRKPLVSLLDTVQPIIRRS